jgi:hypothetical protein
MVQLHGGNKMVYPSLTTCTQLVTHERATARQARRRATRRTQRGSATANAGPARPRPVAVGTYEGDRVITPDPILALIWKIVNTGNGSTKMTLSVCYAGNWQSTVIKIDCSMHW